MPANFLKKQRDKYYHLNYGENAISSFCETIKAANGDIEVIVDLGVGGGRDISNAGRYFKEAARFGVDFQPDLAKLVDLGVTPVQLNLEHQRFPFNDESVDIIIANQVYEHLKEIFWVTHEAVRVLRVGGYFILGVPNLAALHNRLLLLFGGQPTCIQSNSAHLRGFTRGDLVKYFDICKGMRLVDYKGQNLYPFPEFVSNFFTKLLPSIAVGNFYLFKKTSAYADEFIKFLDKERLETNYYRGMP